MLRITLLAVTLAAVPGLTLAQGCDHNRSTAMTCADGTVPDPETGTCVPSSTS